MAKQFKRILNAQPTPALREALNYVPFQLPGEPNKHWKLRRRWLLKTLPDIEAWPAAPV